MAESQLQILIDGILVAFAYKHDCAVKMRLDEAEAWGGSPLTLVTNLSSAYPILQAVGLDNAKGIITRFP